MNALVSSISYLYILQKIFIFVGYEYYGIKLQIRVSSKISDSPIILTIDCDHYSNNSKSVRDALCFFMDDKQSNNIAFVQFPQSFANITKNDLYGNSTRVIYEVKKTFCNLC